jgi:hypothetical protein
MDQTVNSMILHCSEIIIVEKMVESLSAIMLLLAWKLVMCGLSILLAAIGNPTLSNITIKDAGTCGIWVLPYDPWYGTGTTNGSATISNTKITNVDTTKPSVINGSPSTFNIINSGGNQWK